MDDTNHHKYKDVVVLQLQLFVVVEDTDDNMYVPLPQSQHNH